MAGLQKKKILIVVRTYPVPARKGIEVSCTAGITEESEWIRLFPVPYRFLDEDRKFSKYQWIEVSVTKASDARKESYKIVPGSISIISEKLSTKKAWRARKDVIFPLKAHCLCCLKRDRDKNGFPTLGIFRPRVIERLVIECDTPIWSEEQLAILRQPDFFQGAKNTELEKIPYVFKYQFRCEHDSCTAHRLSCTDWEMGQSWRKWKAEYGDQWQPKFRETYEQAMIGKNDTHFIVGTVHTHPKEWIIVGLFYPPHEAAGDKTLGLFDQA